MVESEETLGALAVPLAALSKSVQNLELPDVQSRQVFEPVVEANDLAASAELDWKKVLDIGVGQSEWPIASETTTTARAELSLWNEFLTTVDFFHHFGFYNVRGSFTDSERSTYQTTTRFKGLAQLDSGSLAAIKGEMAFTWSQQAPESEKASPVWLVSAMRTEEFKLARSEGPMFVDVGEAAFDPDDHSLLASSDWDELLIDMVLGVTSGQVKIDDMVTNVMKTLQDGSFPFQVNQVAVVDIDRDGFDDFYFTAFDGKAMFFRNRGDGTFEEISEELGLSLERVFSAFFADFDNDGDADAFLSFFNDERGTQYFLNEDGRFVARMDLVAGSLPAWTLPISAADYDNDGLLDVYLGTYTGQYMGPWMMASEEARRAGRADDIQLPLLSEEDSKAIFERMRRVDADPVANKPGAPNLLLKNMGEEGFAPAPNAESMKGYLNTLSTAWSDFDQDGDMDVYVVNEAGPNQMMQNNGDGTFTEVSDDISGEVSFGMGGAWGDYDNDGRQDLYTSNMYSKAGLRITEQMGSAERLVQSARGNTLMRNTPDGFVKVSGIGPKAAPVETAGFGWGGSFADFNNDGRLDIYSTAGGFTVPKQVATIGDT